MTTNVALAHRVATVDIPAMLTGPQIRAARALLKISAEDLAERTKAFLPPKGVSYATIQRAEQVEDMPNMQSKNLLAIKAALEAAGAVFLDSGENRDGGPGVRLKRS